MWHTRIVHLSVLLVYEFDNVNLVEDGEEASFVTGRWTWHQGGEIPAWINQRLSIWLCFYTNLFEFWDDIRMYVVVIAAPHMTGLMLWLAVKLVEAPVIGSFIIGYLKKQNNMNEVNFNHPRQIY